MKAIKRILVAAALALLPAPLAAQSTIPQFPISGPSLISGDALNVMVNAINNIQGNGTAAAGSFTTLRATGAVTFTSTLAVTGVTIFTAIPVAPATGITLGSTTFSEATLALYAKGVAAGYKVARGETALDGSNPTPVASGLATIVACSLTIKATAAPGVGTSVVTYDTSTSTLNMYGWKVTGTGDTTLIASTGTDTIGWVCVGT